MLLRLIHSLNAYVSISVTLSGIMTVFSFGQCANAAQPILVTPSGMVTDLSSLSIWNARSGISVIPSGNTAPPSTIGYFLMALYFILER